METVNHSQRIIRKLYSLPDLPIIYIPPKHTLQQVRFVILGVEISYNTAVDLPMIIPKFVIHPISKSYPDPIVSLHWIVRACMSKEVKLLF